MYQEAALPGMNPDPIKCPECNMPIPRGLGGIFRHNTVKKGHVVGHGKYCPIKDLTAEETLAYRKNNSPED